MKQIGTPFTSSSQAIGFTGFLFSMSAWMCKVAYDELTTSDNPDYLYPIACVGLLGITGLAVNNAIAYFSEIDSEGL